MSVEEFLGGVRVLQPSDENLRDPPPLDVFDTFPNDIDKDNVNCISIILINTMFTVS